MDIRLKIVAGGDDGKVYWLKVAALTLAGKPVDRDIFRFPKQTKRILLNPPPDPLNPPPNWKPKLSVPRECNIFDYGILTDIASRHFLRRQGKIATGKAWAPAGWTKQSGVDLVLPVEEQRHLPFLAARLASMSGAELLVDAPDISGVLKELGGAPGTVSTISAAYDGGGFGSTCNDTNIVLIVGKDSGGNFRVYCRFSLSVIPIGSIITAADFKINVTVSDSDPTTMDIQGYNASGTVGQDDPEAEGTCGVRLGDCADDASPYLDNNTALQSTGIKTLVLPATALTDIEAAKVAVDRFSLGINENDTPAIPPKSTSNFEALEAAGTDEPKLVLTHRPPGAMGVVV